MAYGNLDVRLWPLSCRWNSYAPGIMVAFMIAATSHYITKEHGGPVMLYALLFGMALNFLSDSERCQPGIMLASSSVLRLGVALLGLQISWAQIVALGGGTIVLIVAAGTATITGGALLARLVGLDKNFSILTAGAVAICGASAALALSSVLPQNKEAHDTLESSTLLTVVGVTALSTIAMIIYPVIIKVAGLDNMTAGIFLGATIHDVAQVIGAGYMISEETGEVAAVVKLLRVACLVPAVMVIGFLFRAPQAAGGADKKRPVFPVFLVGFILCVAIGGMGVLPDAVMDFFSGVSRWSLVAAVAALGMKTSLKKLLAIGYAPIIALVAQTCFLAVFVLAILM